MRVARLVHCEITQFDGGSQEFQVFIIGRFSRRANGRAEQLPRQSFDFNSHCAGKKSYLAAAVADFVYFRRTGLTINPMRIALALTLIRTMRPSTTARHFLDIRLELSRRNPGNLSADPAKVLGFAAMGDLVPEGGFLTREITNSWHCNPPLAGKNERGSLGNTAGHCKRRGKSAGPNPGRLKKLRREETNGGLGEPLFLPLPVLWEKGKFEPPILPRTQYGSVRYHFPYTEVE